MNRGLGPGMSPATALRIEFGIIGLGILALAMIFQPFALWIFSLGCCLVVLAALANNLLPMARPGRPLRDVIFAALVVALVFCSALLVAIGAAHLYGMVFLNPPPAATSLAPPAPPFWLHPMPWTLAALALGLALALRRMIRR